MKHNQTLIKGGHWCNCIECRMMRYQNALIEILEIRSFMELGSKQEEAVAYCMSEKIANKYLNEFRTE